MLRSLKTIAGLLNYLLLKLVLRDTLPVRYPFALENWVLIIKLSKKQLNFKLHFYESLILHLPSKNSSVWSSNISLITIQDANFPAASSKNTNTSRDRPSSNTAFLSSQLTRNQRKCDRRTKHPDFLTTETHATQAQFYKLWVQSHHSGISRLQSQVSYHPWPEQWLWICHF